MLRILNTAILLLAMLLTAGSTNAQALEDPTSWKYEVKKKSATEYQLIFHLDLKKGWHIWSLNPGGDGYEIPPAFTFHNNTKVTLKGKATEKGKPTITKMEGIDGKVTYYSGKVDYTQNVTVTGKTKIMGTLSYQVCNDMMCLPPKDKEFEFEIK